MEKEDKIKSLEEELEKTKKELDDTKEHLKKYTAPLRSKTYYKNHKEEILEKMKFNPIPTDKRKEYNKLAYQKKKEKMKKNNEII